MGTRLLLRCLAAGGVLLVVAGCGRFAKTHTPASAADLASQCASSVGTDGYGIVDLTQDLTIANDSGEITVNCTIHLHNTATLTLSGSQLKTRNLIISDDKPDSQTSNLKLSSSTLTGVGTVALVVDLRHALDTINVQHSTITYGLGVWMLADGRGTGSDAGGGTVAITDSTVQSTDSSSRGIRIAASSARGVGTFVNDIFQTPSSTGLAVLYASTCHEQQVTGAPGACAIAPPVTTATATPQPPPPGTPSITLSITSLVVTPGGALPPTTCWATKGVSIVLTATDHVGGPGVKEIDYTLSGAQAGTGVLGPGGGTAALVTAAGQTTLTYFAVGQTGSRADPMMITAFLDPSIPLACVPAPTVPSGLAEHGTIEVKGTITTNGQSYPFDRTFSF